ncbi:MAG: type IV pilus biogenesis/stability protein PilW [Gammaproteobacteria bacterium]
MASLKKRGLRLLVIVPLLAASACITTSSRPPLAPASPEDAAQYNLQLGISYLRDNKLQAAREKFERALKQEPRLATAEWALGVVFERLEDPKGAEVHYRRALELDGSDPDALNAMAVFTCNYKQDPAEALKLFDRAIAVPLSRKVANRVMLYTNAGTCAKQVDLARSEAYLRKALKEDPQFGDALLQLAQVTLDEGKPLQARGFLERYMAQSPATAATLYLGARIEQALNDDTAARHYSDRLRNEFPESNEVRQLAEQAQSRS